MKLDRKDSEMTNSTLTYPQRWALEKARLEALPLEVKQANAASHFIGNVDGVSRCITCEIGSWNAWQKPCL
jgi:hypothetical protein